MVTTKSINPVVHACRLQKTGSILAIFLVAELRFQKQKNIIVNLTDATTVHLSAIPVNTSIVLAARIAKLKGVKFVLKNTLIRRQKQIVYCFGF